MASKKSQRAMIQSWGLLKMSTWRSFQGITLLLLLNSGKLHSTTCLPDTLQWTPTPTLVWDSSADLDLAKYVLYCASGGVWQKIVDLPCNTDEESGFKSCQNYAAVQKYSMCNAEFNLNDYAVKACDSIGQCSPDYSNVVTVCAPHIWIPPEPYN